MSWVKVKFLCSILKFGHFVQIQNKASVWNPEPEVCRPQGFARHQPLPKSGKIHLTLTTGPSFHRAWDQSSRSKRGIFQNIYSGGELFVLHFSLKNLITNFGRMCGFCDRKDVCVLEWGWKWGFLDSAQRPATIQFRSRRKGEREE